MRQQRNHSIIVKPVNESYEEKKDLTNLFHYICREDKAIHHLYRSYGCRIKNAELAAKDFLEVKEFFHKHPSTLARHKVISFEDGTFSTPQQAFEIAKEIATYYTDHFQVAYAVHEDRNENSKLNKNYHIHLIINSVNYKNGKIFHEGPPNNIKFQKYIEEIMEFYE